MDNKEWIFSGIGVAAIVTILGLLKRAARKEETINPGTSSLQSSIVNSISIAPFSNAAPLEDDETENRALKARTNILFVDDDKTFKIVNMLRRSGWRNVEIVSDLSRLDSEKVQLADIIFLDIQGVGRKMGFSEEGLGLAKALRKEYPSKKLVIYSAVTSHNPFADGFRVADERKSKNAELYEFQTVITNLLK